MAESFAAEIKWWNARRAEFDSKRASLSPLSYGHFSRAYSVRGNANGAALYDSMRLDIYKRAAEYQDQLTQELIQKKTEERRTKEFGKALTKYQKGLKTRYPGTPAESPVLAKIKNSEKVTELEEQVQRTENKIIGLGGTVTRTLIDGFSRALDLLSRTTYAVQNVRMDEIQRAKDSGGNITVAEHLKIAAAPVKILSPLVFLSSRLSEDSPTDSRGNKQTLIAAAKGFTGKSKVTGSDVLKSEFPNWSAKNKSDTAALGFISDVVSDPLTYLTIGEGTAVRVVGAAGAKVAGKHAMARALIDETLFSKAGREAAKNAFKQSRQATKLAPESRNLAKANKSFIKASKTASRAAKTGKGVDEATEKLTRSAQALHDATEKFSLRQSEVLKEELTGAAAGLRYALRHPFNTANALSAGTKMAGLSSAGAKAAEAAQKTMRAEAFNHFTTGPAGDVLRMFHVSLIGKDLTYRAGKVFKVSEDFEKFVDDFLDVLYPIQKVTGNTRKANQARKGMLAALKMDQHSLIDAIIRNGKIDALNEIKSDLLGATTPFDTAASAAKNAAKAEKATGPVGKADTAATVNKVADAPDSTPAPAPVPNPASAPNNVASPVAADAALSAASDSHDEVIIQSLLSAITDNKVEFNRILPELLDGRDANTAAMDAINGLSDRAIGVKELFKAKLQEALQANTVETDGLGNIVKAEQAAPNTTSANIRYTRAINRRIAESIREAYEETIRQIALVDLANDPELIVKSMVESTDEILNWVSADTQIQVRELLHYHYGMSVPSMALPLKRVHDYMAIDSSTGFPMLYTGFPTVRGGKEIAPHYIEQHFREYLLDRIGKTFSDPKAKLDDFVDNPGMFNINTAQEIDDYVYDNLETIFDDVVMANPDIVGRLTKVDAPMLEQALQALADDAKTLFRINYTQKTPGVDKYTVLDHFAFRSGNKELQIQPLKKPIRDIDPKNASGTPSIGRAAFANVNINTDGIPEMGARVLDSLKKLDSIKNKLLRGAKDNQAVIDSINATFDEVTLKFIGPDLFRSGQIGPNGLTINPSKMLESLGTHLNLLHDTQPFKKFDLRWRELMANRLWHDASLSAELNQSISVGVLNKLVSERMTPMETATWLSEKIKQYPAVERILRESDAMGVSTGNVGSGISTDITGLNVLDDQVAEIAAKAPDNTAKALADNEMEDVVPMVPSPEDILAQSNAEDAADAAKAAQSTDAESSPGLNPSGVPGGFAAPDGLTQDEIVAIQNVVNALFSEVDTLKLSQYYAGARSFLVADVAMYDARIRDMLNQYQIATTKTLRVAGLPVMPLPHFNNPLHTYAGLGAVKQNQGRVSTWLSEYVLNQNYPWVRRFNENFRRPSSYLDATLNDIRSSVSNTALGQLSMIHEHIKATYGMFKNRKELRAAIRDFFDPMAHVDPKLDQVEKRFNDVFNDIMAEAMAFKGHDVAHTDPYVVSSVELIFNSLPQRFQVPPGTFGPKAFNSKEQPFSREWLMDLSTYLSHNASTSWHPLSADKIDRLDLPSFEYAVHNASMKLRMRNETFRSMYEQFAVPMSGVTVTELNKTLEAEDQLVRVISAMGSRFTPAEFATDHYITRGMAEEMKKIAQFLDSAMRYHRGEINFELLSKINNYWKGLVTTWNIPKYHVGNAMSDAFMSALDGVGFKSYRKAATVMAHSHDVSKKVRLQPDEFSKFMAPDMTVTDAADVMREAEFIGNPAHAAHVTTIFANGKMMNLNSEQIMKWYIDFGLGQNQTVGNLLKSGTMDPRSVGKAFSVINDKLMDFSNAREDYFRLSHFIHALEAESKMGDRPLIEIVRAARDRVVKYHFDYSDVSAFERNYVGKYMPFYKWARNIVPLAFTTFFTNPKAYTIPMAANRAISGMMFPTQEDAQGNVIPFDTVIPRFVTEQQMMPIGAYQDPEGNQQMRYAVLNLPLDQTMVRWIMPLVSPFADPNNSLTESIHQGVMGAGGATISSMNPYITAGAQIGTGMKPSPGGAYENDDFETTLLGLLIPGLNEINTMNRENAKGVPWDAGRVLAQVGIIRGINVTDAQKRGELREQQDALTPQLKTASANWLRQNWPGVDPNSDQGKKLVHTYLVNKGVLQK